MRVRIILSPEQEGIKLSKLIDYKGIRIWGWMFPFRVEDNSRLIRIDYEAGFGEESSVGFGMVEAAKEEK